MTMNSGPWGAIRYLSAMTVNLKCKFRGLSHKKANLLSMLGFKTTESRRILLLDAYHSVAPSFGGVGGSNASTRSSNFGIPSVFEMKSTPMASHRDLGSRSV